MEPILLQLILGGSSFQFFNIFTCFYVFLYVFMCFYVVLCCTTVHFKFTLWTNSKVSKDENVYTVQ